MKAPWELHWDPCYFAAVQVVCAPVPSLCALGRQQYHGYNESARLSRFRAFIAKNSNAFLLSSKPLVYPPPLFRTEIFSFKSREENCNFFFYSAAVGKSHKITVSFNMLICLSMQGGKLAFSSPCGLIPHPSIG